MQERGYVQLHDGGRARGVQDVSAQPGPDAGRQGGLGRVPLLRPRLRHQELRHWALQAQHCSSEFIFFFLTLYALIFKMWSLSQLIRLALIKNSNCLVILVSLNFSQFFYHKHYIFLIIISNIYFLGSDSLHKLKGWKLLFILLA